MLYNAARLLSHKLCKVPAFTFLDNALFNPNITYILIVILKIFIFFHLQQNKYSISFSFVFQCIRAH